MSDLITKGLLGELHLFVNPTAIGAGMPVFPTSAPTSGFASSLRNRPTAGSPVALRTQALLNTAADRRLKGAPPSTRFRSPDCAASTPRSPASKPGATCYHTPGCCQSRTRRQHVTGLRSRSALAGRCRQGQPVSSRNTMPTSTLRFGTGGSATLGRGGSGGGSGATRCHSSSVLSPARLS